MKLTFAFYLLFVCALMACQQEKTSVQQPLVDSVKEIKKITQVQEQKQGKKVNQVFTDTVKFLEYSDDGDYPLVFFNQKNERSSYIYKGKEEVNFLRGDQVIINWKQDSIWIAGDGDKLELTPCIINIRKFKDGSVSNYRKTNPKSIKYWTAEKDGYSNEFKDYLYTWVEYYLANTKNDLVKRSVKAKDDLVYSIEDTQKNGRAYTMLGLSKESEGHSNILVWLYLDSENIRFYEYDLANDKLVEFK